MSSSEPEIDRRRPLEDPTPIGEPRADGLRRLIAVVDRLRAPDGGCAAVRRWRPWVAK